ncbi:Amino acid permease 2 -like protein [Gossypium arboreum]|uniref:Amino acid permease 2-like protein n=1 Tax=Gossypium arboreum TaxID=29729 RepID=A0A0B0MDA0_GOSAR|nr:amino acid permease 2-like [Gossypium arboreum]KHF98326.1 Amino acid permease 2 -like protein [Gossypium arboreum]
MGEKCAGKTHLHSSQVFDLSVLPQGGFKCRLTTQTGGPVSTASAHIITAVIGLGVVLFLAWPLLSLDGLFQQLCSCSLLQLTIPLLFLLLVPAVMFLFIL